MKTLLLSVATLLTVSATYAQTTWNVDKAHSKVGFTIIEHFNYFYNWLLMGFIGIIGIYLYYILDKNIKLEMISKNLKTHNKIE